ncbi:septum formation initiator family protein [Streptomyces sp. NPDC060011]|jgi:cell division protein FtsB|uniref:FtsB family cell division protein n=1 Tax=unclassified Streptomyces TaxID=2593676 RepID=UPI0009C0DB87|nr:MULTISPECIES: septum formation initiator family protein [unclassified Streptomyces]MCX4915180.1 septum formation initiator family protein [Streptomyces sp. NBC_00687]MCX5132724.1 septum formation initiator family protein [Streptomyces sp. NBC_00340]MCX5283795.1 septum formation initiator family protein [Streptomyces sp. NBC_00198]NEB29731.1 septum formation initiator family protein [Streptomyces sp. SID14446]OQQ16746.1 acyl-phosphate glycerol 3-phosphate acyltransferase [Streptomyces sp. M4
MAVKDRDRFSTSTRLKLLGEQTAARVYRSQTKRQARRSRLTGRAALLALVLCSLIVALAYPMRQYVSQRAEVADLEHRQEQARQRVEQLRDLKARWQDDAYAEQQIRQRLHYVMPGENGYIVVDPDAAKQARAGQGAADRPWYTNVWDGVDKSDAADQ